MESYRTKFTFVILSSDRKRKHDSKTCRRRGESLLRLDDLLCGLKDASYFMRSAKYRETEYHDTEKG